MDRILILKLGALGDVIRTTPILRVLKGEVTWVTARSAMPLLSGNPRLARVLPIDKAEPLRKQKFDLVLNLEEDRAACELAMAVEKRELVGPYFAGERATYTDSSAEWFDMSLISRLGKKAADRKKWANRKSYQEILFAMIGRRFSGEEYFLPVAAAPKHKGAVRVGLEARSGERWVAKRWPRVPEFEKLLEEAGMSGVRFRQFPTLKQFIRQVNGTDAVVTSDSLALHIALGLRKKVVAVFTCTSPQEIHGYGRAVKIVSPLLKKFYYSTAKSLESGAAIPPARVLRALNSLLG